MTAALQKAIVTQIEAELTTPIYDRVPQSAEYPYITYNGADVQDADYLVERMDEIAVSLNVWSRGGQAEVQQIMSQIDTALDRQRLALDEGTMVSMRVTNRRTAREPDTYTFMGQVSLLVMIHY